MRHPRARVAIGKDHLHERAYSGEEAAEATRERLCEDPEALSEVTLDRVLIGPANANDLFLRAWSLGSHGEPLDRQSIGTFVARSSWGCPVDLESR